MCYLLDSVVIVALMLGNIGPLEIGIVLVVLLLLFGPKRLPELGSGIGRGLREFKNSITGASDVGPEMIDAPAVEAGRVIEHDDSAVASDKGI